MNALLLLLVVLAAAYAFYRSQRDTPGGRFSIAERDDDARSPSERWGDGGWIIEREVEPEAEPAAESEADAAEDGDEGPEWHEPVNRDKQRRERRAARAARRGGGVVDDSEPGDEQPRPRRS